MRALILAGLVAIAGCAPPCLKPSTTRQGEKLGQKLGVLYECWADGAYCRYFVGDREVVVTCSYAGCRPVKGER